MSKETVIEDWLRTISCNAGSARIGSGIGVARLENGKPSVVTLEPTGNLSEDGRQVFKATLLHEGGVVQGGDIDSDITLDEEHLHDIQRKNETAVKKYKSLI